MYEFLFNNFVTKAYLNCIRNKILRYNVHDSFYEERMEKEVWQFRIKLINAELEFSKARFEETGMSFFQDEINYWNGALKYALNFYQELGNSARCANL